MQETTLSCEFDFHYRACLLMLTIDEEVLNLSDEWRISLCLSSTLSGSPDVWLCLC